MAIMQWGKTREIEFNYLPGEAATCESPGCEEEIEIVGIMVRFPGYEEFDLLGEGVLPEEAQEFLLAEAEEFVRKQIREERERGNDLG